VNTPLVCSWPHLNGKPLDLRKLHSVVAALGGWERVCERNKWSDVCAQLDGHSPASDKQRSSKPTDSQYR
jgi:hypothetical protein